MKYKTKWQIFAGLVWAALMMAPLTGCGKKGQAEAEKEMDLSQAGDLFRQPLRGEKEPADTDTAASVDGQNITWGEVRREVDRAMQVAVQQKIPSQQLPMMRNQITRQAVEMLIVKRMLAQAAERENISVTDEELQKAHEQLMGRLPPDVTLEEALARQGISKEEFDQELATELRINKLVESHIGTPAEPTEEEVAKFYEEHKDRMDVPETVTARHILIAVKPDATAEEKQAAKAKAEEMHAKLVEGADFAALAKEYSDCPSKEQGGLLPRFGRGDMVKPFEDAAFSQKKDEIGPVVETPFGYHVIQVSEHAEPHRMTLEEVRTNLVRGMKAQKSQAIIRDYIEGLRAKANIQYNIGVSAPPAEAQGAPGAQPAPAEEPPTTEIAPAPEPTPAVEPIPEPETVQ